MWLQLQAVFSSERCTLFKVSFIERFHCTILMICSSSSHRWFLWTFGRQCSRILRTRPHQCQSQCGLEQGTVPTRWSREANSECSGMLCVGNTDSTSGGYIVPCQHANTTIACTHECNPPPPPPTHTHTPQPPPAAAAPSIS